MEHIFQQDEHDWDDIFDNITDMITIHDKDFNIVRANKAAQQILGLPGSNIARTKCFKIYHGHDSPPEGCISCQSLMTGKPVAFEAFEPHLNMHLEIRAMPRFDRNNQIVGVIHISRDITKKKEMEEALLRSEQMRLVGEWSAGLINEIKNSLAGIKAAVEFLLDESSISEENRDVVFKAVHEVKQIDHILKDLLSFSKPHSLNLMLTDVNEVLDKTINFSLTYPVQGGGCSRELKVYRDLSADLPRILTDPIHLRQIFLNIILNAIEAMPDGGILSLHSNYDHSTETIRVVISDTGHGIEGAEIEKIFQPFYSTKGKGSGLGLAIVKRLVEQLKGGISVESVLGKGTRFKLNFPVTGNSEGI